MSVISLQTRANLIALYGEGHRYYHTIEHVYDCLSKLEEYNNKTNSLSSDEYNICDTALWFHDAVYNPKSKNNELYSARLLYGTHEEKKLAEFNNFSFIENVKNCILDTKTHIPTSELSKIVCDIDMSILGEEHNIYKEYVRNIIKEYEFVPTQQFIQFRSKFLTDLLQQSRIFHTDYFHDLYDSNAKQNITSELRNYTK